MVGWLVSVHNVELEEEAFQLEPVSVSSVDLATIQLHNNVYWF